VMVWTCGLLFGTNPSQGGAGDKWFQVYNGRVGLLLPRCEDVGMQMSWMSSSSGDDVYEGRRSDAR
jgi:hypothetical protein